MAQKLVRTIASHSLGTRTRVKECLLSGKIFSFCPRGMFLNQKYKCIVVFIIFYFFLVILLLNPFHRKTYYDKSDPTTAENRFQNVLRTVQSFGDYEKLHGGVFENYLHAKFRDSYFQSVRSALELIINGLI